MKIVPKPCALCAALDCVLTPLEIEDNGIRRIACWACEACQRALASGDEEITPPGVLRLGFVAAIAWAGRVMGRPA